jgi:hypothetical protein
MWTVPLWITTLHILVVAIVLPSFFSSDLGNTYKTMASQYRIPQCRYKSYILIFREPPELAYKIIYV